MAGLFGGGAGGAGAPAQNMVPTSVKDCPSWDRLVMSYQDWRADVDDWVEAGIVST